MKQVLRYHALQLAGAGAELAGIASAAAAAGFGLFAGIVLAVKVIL